MYMITGECISEAINVYASLEGALNSAALKCEGFDMDLARSEVEQDGMHIAFLNERWTLDGKDNLIMIRSISVKD